MQQITGFSFFFHLNLFFFGLRSLFQTPLRLLVHGIWGSWAIQSIKKGNHGWFCQVRSHRACFRECLCLEHARSLRAIQKIPAFFLFAWAALLSLFHLRDNQKGSKTQTSSQLFFKLSNFFSLAWFSVPKTSLFDFCGSVALFVSFFSFWLALPVQN